jgi:hypothetical protein
MRGQHGKFEGVNQDNRHRLSRNQVEKWHWPASTALNIVDSVDLPLDLLPSPPGCVRRPKLEISV